ncbi:MAG: nucleotidyl transferase AbiEii/AbiGii toxin family protein [Anaerolineaceae bacterium]|nr:nucleotidyl transferase AbiEii/AbiGii toxin family protein [Anaerolineaceae bacterium]
MNMFLHKNDRELFHDVIVTVSERMNIAIDIVEKDYYVTMILGELAKRCDNVVFKGGTSISKAYKAIDRFSEDVDITFTEHIGSSRRKKLKYQVLYPISEILEMPISNWDRIESDKDYNRYDFIYQSVVDETNTLQPWVKVETALMSYAFPTETRYISNIIFDCLQNNEPEILADYHLNPFPMKVQTLSRTLIDKMFAVCDYFLLGKARRNSRHLYDIYKLYLQISDDASFAELICEVYKQRAQMDQKRTPAAQSGVNIVEVVQKLCDEDFYKDDYEETTKKIDF